jgi:hypothetical protein
MARCPECGRSNIKNKKTKDLIKQHGKCGMCLLGRINPKDTKRFSRYNNANQGEYLINQ